MTREQRGFLAIFGELGPMNSLVAWIELRLSEPTRMHRRRMVAVSQVLRASLGDPEEGFAVSIGKRRSASTRNLVQWVALGLLIVIAVIEFRSYSFPTLRAWLQVFLHRCGL